MRGCSVSVIPSKETALRTNVPEVVLRTGPATETAESPVWLKSTEVRVAEPVPVTLTTVDAAAVSENLMLSRDSPMPVPLRVNSEDVDGVSADTV